MSDVVDLFEEVVDDMAAFYDYRIEAPEEREDTIFHLNQGPDYHPLYTVSVKEVEFGTKIYLYLGAPYDLNRFTTDEFVSLERATAMIQGEWSYYLIISEDDNGKMSRDDIILTKIVDLGESHDERYRTARKLLGRIQGMHHMFENQLMQMAEDQQFDGTPSVGIQ